MTYVFPIESATRAKARKAARAFLEGAGKGIATAAETFGFFNPKTVSDPQGRELPSRPSEFPAGAPFRATGPERVYGFTQAEPVRPGIPTRAEMQRSLDAVPASRQFLSAASDIAFLPPGAGFVTGGNAARVGTFLPKALEASDAIGVAGARVASQAAREAAPAARQFARSEVGAVGKGAGEAASQLPIPGPESVAALMRKKSTRYGDPFPGGDPDVPVLVRPAHSLHSDQWVLYNRQLGTYGGRPRATFEEAVEAANKENRRRYEADQAREAAFKAEHGVSVDEMAEQARLGSQQRSRRPRETAPAESPSPTAAFDRDLRRQLKEREGKRFKTAGDEITITRLRQMLAASPSKWQIGQGVGWKPTAGQVNRGYRIIAVHPETKEATIQAVRDVGQLADFSMEPERVSIIDLLRDKRFDKPPAAESAPTPRNLEPAAGPTRETQGPISDDVYADTQAFLRAKAAADNAIRNRDDATLASLERSIEAITSRLEQQPGGMAYLERRLAELNRANKESVTELKKAREVAKSQPLPATPPKRADPAALKRIEEEIRALSQRSQEPPVIPSAPKVAQAAPEPKVSSTETPTLVELEATYKRLSDELSGYDYTPPAELRRDLDRVGAQIRTLRSNAPSPQPAAAQRAQAPAVQAVQQPSTSPPQGLPPSSAAGGGPPVEPPKPPTATGGGPPSGEDPIKRLTGLIRAAKPAREETEVLKSAELRQRAGRLAAAQRNAKGQEALLRTKSTLAGELPRAEFDPPKAGLSQPEWDGLFDQINAFDLRPFEKVNAAEALKTVQDGRIPTLGDIALLEKVFGEEFAAAILAKRPRWQRWWEEALGIANVPRALVASLDLSAPLRQGVVFAAAHPKEWGQALGPMVKAFAKPGVADAVDDAIRNSQYAPMMERAKLYLAPRAGAAVTLTAREEAFMSRLAQKIPWVRASERAYVTFLNKLRADVFETIVKNWEADGKTVTAQDLEGLGRWINRATGRGSLGPLEKGNAGAVLNATFFSPKFALSRVQAPLSLAESSSLVRKQAARDLAAFVGTGVTVLALLDISGLADVEVDPRSSDFGKVRIGPLRYDFWGGFQPVARYATQFLTKQRKTLDTGNIAPVEGQDVLFRFLRSKLAPVPGLAWDFYSGNTYTGDDPSLSKEAVETFTPLFLQDLYEAGKELGLVGATAAVPSAFGVGVQVFDPENAGSRPVSASSARRPARRPSFVTQQSAPSRQAGPRKARRPAFAGSR